MRPMCSTAPAAEWLRAIVARHGLALKLFADFQNEAIVAANIIGEGQLRGLWPLADRYREVAGAIMVVLEPG